MSLLALGVCLGAMAQPGPAAPTAEQMIEQLEKKPQRTRSLRNLSVEQAPAAPESTAAPAAPAAAIQTPAVPTPVAEPPSLSLLIEFDYDSARVRPESQQVLQLLAQAMQSARLRHSRFLIEGHTDAKGSAGYNLRLSRLRAESVRDFLSAQGVAGERLQVVGKGSSEPANRAQPLASENRRVRIVNQD